MNKKMIYFIGVLFAIVGILELLTVLGSFFLPPPDWNRAEKLADSFGFLYVAYIHRELARRL